MCGVSHGRGQSVSPPERGQMYLPDPQTCHHLNHCSNVGVGVPNVSMIASLECDLIHWAYASITPPVRGGVMGFGSSFGRVGNGSFVWNGGRNKESIPPSFNSILYTGLGPAENLCVIPVTRMGIAPLPVLKVKSSP